MTQWLALVMRHYLLLRSLLILADLVVVVGDLVDVESLTHALGSRHSTLVVRQWALTYIEARGLHRWVHGSRGPFRHDLLLDRDRLASFLLLVQLIFVHTPRILGHVLRVRRRSHVGLAIVTHVPVTSDRRRF